MAESENYKKGTAIRRKLMGEKYADAMNKSVYDDPPAGAGAEARGA